MIHRRDKTTGRARAPYPVVGSVLTVLALSTVLYVSLIQSKPAEANFEPVPPPPQVIDLKELPCERIEPGVWDCSDDKTLRARMQVKKTKVVTVTMYTSRAAETDDSPCIAANNKDICKLLEQGVQTCASNDYAFGTKLKIEGLGTCIVMDRMNRRYTGKSRVDWYNGFDLVGARKHGVQQLNLSILDGWWE